MLSADDSFDAFLRCGTDLTFNGFCACAQLSGHGLDLMYGILDRGDLSFNAEIKTVIDEYFSFL